jgi:hypothetical protein
MLQANYLHVTNILLIIVGRSLYYSLSLFLKTGKWRHFSVVFIRMKQRPYADPICMRKGCLNLYLNTLKLIKLSI